MRKPFMCSYFIFKSLENMGSGWKDKPFVFWATLGGTVEAGESDSEAAKRELGEELKLDIPLTGPVHSNVSQYEHEGIPVINTDVFFVGHCDQENLSIHGITASESVAMQETRWWSDAEIEQSSETIVPPDLAKVISKIGSSGTLPPI